MKALQALETAVVEAADPKRLMGIMRSAQKRIWPSDRYYINVSAPWEDWDVGEFCPVTVRHDGSCWPADGMYGLDKDISDAIHYVEGNSQSEEQLEKWMNHYEGTMLSDIRNGKTRGEINGVVGKRLWRLVYAPNQNFDPRTVEAVVAGKQYGPELQQEAVDPKRVLQALRAGDFIKIRVYGNVIRHGGSERTVVGWLEVNGNGYTRNVDVTGMEGFNQSWVDAILRDLRRGKMGGSFGRHIHYWWSTDDRDQARKMTSTAAPVLTVTTPAWTIQMPVINDVRWQTLGWLPGELTPEQKAFMQEHGETIWYAMNEGGDYEDDIRNYDAPDADEEVVGHWSVTGDPDRAPEHEGEWSYG